MRQLLASFLIHHIGAFRDLVNFERLLAERAEDIFSIIQHGLVHAAEARTAAVDATLSCFRALGSRKPTNCTSFCACNSFTPEPSVFCCDIGPGDPQSVATSRFNGNSASAGAVPEFIVQLLRTKDSLCLSTLPTTTDELMRINGSFALADCAFSVYARPTVPCHSFMTF